MNFTTNQIFKSVICLTVSFFLTALTAGIIMVISPNVYNNNNVSDIGIAGLLALEFLFAVIVTSFLSHFSKKASIIKLSMIAAIVYAILALMVFFYVNYFFRVILAILLGSCWLSFVTMRLSWLNDIVNNKQRAMAIGLYSAIVSLGFTLGPVIVKAFGADNYFVMLLASAQVILAFVVLLPIQKSQPKNLDSKRISLKRFFVKNPRCFAARFLLDFQVSAILFFTVVFGKKIHLSAEDSGLLISAFAISGLFDFIIGFFILKYNPYRIISVAFTGTLMCFLLVSVFHDFYKITAILYFCYGVFAGFIFIAVATITNNSYAKEKLLAANATFQILGVTGTIFGILVCGILMQIFDFYGYFLTVILANLAYFSILKHKRFKVNMSLFDKNSA